MLNIVICEDNKLTINYIKKLLKKILKEKYKVKSYTNPSELEENFNNEVDIVLMDIVFADTNGIDCVKRIQKRKVNLKIIYISDYIEYAEKIFETNPTYFLKKPIKEDNLQKALDKAIRDIENANFEELTLISKRKVVKLELPKVVFFESNRRLLIVHTEKEQFDIYMKLSELEEKLPKYFIRCHQSYIVNLKMVAKVNNNEFIMKTGEQISISKSKKAEVREKIMKYIGEII